MLERLTTIILSLGLLPSLTALSHQTQYLGPVNFVKVGAPFLIYYLWTRRKAFSPKLLKLLGVALAVGTVSTFLSAQRCDFPPLMIREWAAIVLGILASLCFVVLPQKSQKHVVLTWAIILYGSAFLDALFPSAIDWLYANVFDPQTRQMDFQEVGVNPLTGIFGRQSLAKLLALMPWILFYVLEFNWITAILAAVSTGSILATTQRGPLMGVMFGWSALILHLWIQQKNSKLAIRAITTATLGVVFTFVLVPKDVLRPRINSIFLNQSQNEVEKMAIANRNIRLDMNKFALKHIAESPLGNACIPPEEFRRAGLDVSHAHSLILHQFRERGWAWGIVHLILWVLALFGAWKSKHFSDSYILAGIVTTLGLGLVDHPWFVINQAMVMGLFLVMGLSRASTK